MNLPQEKQLVAMARQGDKQAFASLYRLWVGKIYAFCIVRLGTSQDSEDLTEKIFLKAMKGIKQFKQESSFATWLYAIARNQVIDFYKLKKIKYSALDLDQIEDTSDDQKEDGQLELKQKRVSLIMSKLPGDYQQVLKLRFMQNLSIRQTAQVLGISENNVKVRQLRALNKAREVMI